MTEVSHNFPQLLQGNTGAVPQFRSQLPSKFSPVHYPAIILSFHPIQPELLTAWLNKL